MALAELLVGMVAEVPLDLRGADLGLVVEAIDVTLPIESRLAADGSLRATAPRGRTRTGFDPPHGQIAVGFVRRP